MKKILSLVLAMLMIISMVPAVFAADASESDYQAAIDYLKTIELYKGTGDSDAADELVQRYQMALFTARMVTGRTDDAYWATEENDSGFTDLEGLNEEALGGVSYAAQQGIVNGIGGGEFAPFDNVTYRDAIVMIVRALGFNYPTGYPWSYINKARELGVLDGISGVTYTVEVKREVIAQLLYNALNAEIKGETLAETAFGVAETIVMVTATGDIAYGKGASKAVKANYVKVAALDAEGEPFGTEYYVPYKDLGLTAATANAAVGTTYAVTHKDNFTKVLASESLSKVFENTVDKKEVTYSFDGKIVLGRAAYTILAPNAGYSNLNNNQGTVTGTKEIKVFKAFGAKAENLIPADAKYLMGADGNIYDVENPFTPYAVYSALINAYFTYDATNGKYVKLSDTEAAELLALTSTTVEGFSNIGADAYAATKVHKDYGVPYDYFKAIASDINGDGTYDRVIIRPYELFRLTAKSSDGKKATIATYTTTVNDAAAAVATTSQEITIADWRQTGINLSTVSAGDFFVAYMADGVAKERELEIVEVVNGAKADDEDKTYVFSAYLRGYDATTNSVIFGSNYETLPFGYFGVINTSAQNPTQAASATKPLVVSNTANYLRQFWNTYVTMHVLNGQIILVEAATDADNYVIVESFTDFSENGLKAIAYSTLADGKAEITISELNGWNLGGFDYDLYQWLKQLADAGLNVADYPLPIELNTVYKVRYVAEDGSYNLVAAAPYAVDKDIYVNNFGYILGVDANGAFASDKRVATNDKDLWIILQGDKVHMFKGKLSTVELYDLDFYKAKGNQFVAVADANTNLGPIYGNVNQGVDYWMYNLAVDKYYNQNYFAQFVYGHFMTNMRTGAVEFVTYDSALAQKEFNGIYVPMVEGGVYKATDKVLKTKDLYSMKEVAATEFASGKYFGKNFTTVLVGAGLPATLDYTNPVVPAGVTGHFQSYAALRDAIAVNMYEEIYDRDFTNTDVNVDSWNAIKAELLANVTFVDRTAEGKRITWKGYANNQFVETEIGTTSTAVAAYVMYDYANKAATVFFDSYVPVVLSTETKSEVTVAGVKSEAVHAANILKGETVVTVKFGAPMNVTKVEIEGAYTDLVYNIDGLSYKVADAEYTGTPVITATKMTKLTGLTRATELFTEKTCGTAELDGTFNFYQHSYGGVNYDYDVKMFDGIIASEGWQKTTSILKYMAFAKMFNADLKEVAEGAADAKYRGIYAIKLTQATDLTALRLITASDYHASIKTQACPRGLDILVSKDGQTWTVAASKSDMVNNGDWVVTAGEGKDTVNAEIALTGADDVLYVALAFTDFSPYGRTGNGQYIFVEELELFN